MQRSKNPFNGQTSPDGRHKLPEYSLAAVKLCINRTGTGYWEDLRPAGRNQPAHIRADLALNLNQLELPPLPRRFLLHPSLPLDIEAPPGCCDRFSGICSNFLKTRQNLEELKTSACRLFSFAPMGSVWPQPPLPGLERRISTDKFCRVQECHMFLFCSYMTELQELPSQFVLQVKLIQPPPTELDLRK